MILDFEVVNIIVFGKHTNGSLFYRVAVLGKSLSEWAGGVWNTGENQGGSTP